MLHVTIIKYATKEVFPVCRTWLVQMKQCFWRAELTLPCSRAVSTEHTGNAVVASILCVQMKTLQEEHVAAPCFAKDKYIYNSTDLPVTLDRGSF